MPSTGNGENHKSADLYTPEQLLERWLGHRRLTHKTIEVFPEDKLFNLSLGGLRPFGELVHEFLGMALPVAKQVATGTWGKHRNEQTDG